VEDPVPAKEVLAREALAFVHLRGEVGGEIALHELAHFVAKGALVGGVFEVHGEFRGAETNSAGGLAHSSIRR
jgi:hypothetical protein